MPAPPHKTGQLFVLDGHNNLQPVETLSLDKMGHCKANGVPIVLDSTTFGMRGEIIMQTGDPERYLQMLTSKGELVSVAAMREGMRHFHGPRYWGGSPEELKATWESMREHEPWRYPSFNVMDESGPMPTVDAAQIGTITPKREGFGWVEGANGNWVYREVDQMHGPPRLSAGVKLSFKGIDAYNPMPEPQMERYAIRNLIDPGTEAETWRPVRAAGDSLEALTAAVLEVAEQAKADPLCEDARAFVVVQMQKVCTHRGSLRDNGQLVYALGTVEVRPQDLRADTRPEYEQAAIQAMGVSFKEGDRVINCTQIARYEMIGGRWTRTD